MTKKEGRFIVLEGIDNCGKTTQSNLVKSYLETLGESVIQTREPGGTESGEEIRNVLLKDRSELLLPDTQALLFFAARNQFLSEVVKPNLRKGISVITDRFAPSSFVYQGIVQGVKTEFLSQLYQQIVIPSGCEPDITIIIDISAEESLKREQNVDNVNQVLIYEKQGIAFRRKLRQGYLDFAKKYSEFGRIEVIDGLLSKEKIHQQICNILSR